MKEIYLVSTIIFINHKVLCLSSNDSLFTPSFELPTLRLLDWNKNKPWLEKCFSDKIHAPIHLLGFFSMNKSHDENFSVVHEYILASISNDSLKLFGSHGYSFIDYSNLNDSPISNQDKNIIRQALSMVSYSK